MKARVGWLKIKEYQFPDSNELVDVPKKAQTLTFFKPDDVDEKQYVQVVVIPVED